MAELDEKTAQFVETLAEKANQLIDADKLEDAWEVLIDALDAIPEPKFDYSESMWLFATLADVYFLCENWDQAAETFQEALQCPEGLGNAFIHLRLGQCFFEMNQLDKAADELARAYMAQGHEIFDDEDEKYLDFLSTRMKLDS